MNSKLLQEEINQIKSNLTELKKQIFIQMVTEGVDDPGILKCVFLAGGPGCFVEGTLVRTDVGYQPIETVAAGTLVYTINEKTGEEELKPVILSHKYAEHTEDLLELEFEDGVIVRCTENHRFYVGGKWVPAKDLIVE
jgi:intein/homing endonuclease